MSGAERFRRYRLRKAARIYEEYLRSGSKLTWAGRILPGWPSS
ncbi:MAG: hypothetical protein ABW003_15070 [Microvirga sp.]